MNDRSSEIQAGLEQQTQNVMIVVEFLAEADPPENLSNKYMATFQANGDEFKFLIREGFLHLPDYYSYVAEIAATQLGKQYYMRGENKDET